MNDCDELIERLHAQAHDQVHLALIARAVPVAAMHLELSLFTGSQARAAEELCDEQ
jgi:hypothetical protein